MDRDAFVAKFGGVYEASPWVAEAAFHAAALDLAQAGIAALRKT